MEFFSNFLPKFLDFVICVINNFKLTFFLNSWILKRLTKRNLLIKINLIEYHKTNSFKDPIETFIKILFFFFLDHDNRNFYSAHSYQTFFCNVDRLHRENQHFSQLWQLFYCFHSMKWSSFLLLNRLFMFWRFYSITTLVDYLFFFLFNFYMNEYTHLSLV